MINYWIELKRFLSDYKKILLFGSIIFSLLFLVFFSLGRFYKPSNPEEEIEETHSDVIDEYIESDRAYFSILVEDIEGDLFLNNALINDYFQVDNVLRDLERNTDIDINEKQEQLIEFEIDESINLINVVKNDSNGVISAYFNLGSESDNIQAARYYYNLIMDNGIEFLNNKLVYEISEPGYELSDQNEETANIEVVDNDNWLDLLIFFISNALQGFIVGIVILIGIILFKVLIDKYLRYIFTYNIGDNDKFMLYDPELKNEAMIKQFIKVPVTGKKRIVSEKSIDNTFIHQEITSSSENMDASIYKSLENINELKNTGEIILVIFPHFTTRKWYKNQMDLIKLYNLPVKIIQYNE